MTYDEQMHDPIPDESDIEPERGLVNSFFDKLHGEDDAGADDDEPPVEQSPWQ